MEQMNNIEIKMHPYWTHYGSDRDGNIYTFKNGKVRERVQCKNGRGYTQFGVRQYGINKMYLCHRFAWECWNGIIPKGMQIHHIDHNKKNNGLDNLQMVTQEENMAYGKKAGVLYGAANPSHPFYWR